MRNAFAIALAFVSLGCFTMTAKASSGHKALTAPQCSVISVDGQEFTVRFEETSLAEGEVRLEMRLPEGVTLGAGEQAVHQVLSSEGADFSSEWILSAATDGFWRFPLCQ